MPEGLLPFGDIVATHGIHGWLRLKSYNPRSTLLSQGSEVILIKEEAEASHRILSSRPHKALTLIKLKDMDTMDAAQAWVGSRLLVRKESLDPPRPGEYYYFQVVGLDVFDSHGQLIGQVSRVLFKEGGDLYVVQGPSKEHLIPAVPEVVQRVDLSSGRIIVNLPPGLLEL